ncbi:acyltransferase family protein [Pseudolysinimonas kribbensis]|uniref:acyltransferase family protein n=1 Tax=Pseudolysinimonas kribbensis TaxID=433641 RepID=UPI0024E18E95|nr:acyltransferase [Pseudolysinimonas kribbensis]
MLGFFAISGYLVTKSAQSSDALQFVWRRFLRIFPGFWAVLLVGAFIVGPIYWMLEGHALGAYFGFGPGSPWAYLYTNALLNIGQYQIWDIWSATTPYGLAGNGGPINGSIWTLVYEFTCYLLIAGLLFFLVLKRAKVLVPIIAACFLLLQVVNLLSGEGTGSSEAARIVPYLGSYWPTNFGLIFFLGATLAIYADRVPYSNWLGAGAGLVSLVTLRFGGFNTLGYFTTAYFVLFLAARLPKLFQRVGARNDYSYGVYLYGWIIEQVLAYAGVNRWGYVPYVFLSLVGAGACAVVSWHLVEKQALKLKDVGPGVGFAGIATAARSMANRRRREEGDLPASQPVEPRAQPAEPRETSA